MSGSLPLKRNWFSAQRQVARLRHKVLVLRAQLIDQRSKRLLQSQHFQEIQANFMTMLSTAVEKRSLEQAQTELAQAYHEIQKSHGELDQQESQTRDLEDRLCILEYRLCKMEDELYEGNTETSDGSTATSSYGTVKDNDPPVLQRLYLSMGNLRILRDRLGDLQFEQQMKFNTRRALLNHGQAVFSEDEYLESYRSEENKTREELAQAETEVRDLMELCLREGINPDVESSSSNLEVHKTPLIVPIEIVNSTMQQYPSYSMEPYGSSPPTGHIFSGNLPTRGRIDTWLKEILYGNDLDTPMPDPNDEGPDCESRTWIKLVRNPGQEPPISSRYSLASIGGLEAFRRTLESHRSHFKLLRPIRSDPGLPTSRPEASEIKTRHRAAFSIA
jgi:hypothetical protein